MKFELNQAWIGLSLHFNMSGVNPLRSKDNIGRKKKEIKEKDKKQNIKNIFYLFI